MPDLARQEPMGLYVHWPFCLAKCPYCDFNSHVREKVDHARWRKALVAELKYFAARTPGRTLSSIFFGGGTPSLMEPATVGAVIDEALRNWSVTDDLEITLEANPTSVEAGKFAGFRTAGVNRVSLGVQALRDDALKALGREHSVTEALAAVQLAHRHFNRVSFDLIYARQHQTLAAWEAELAEALELAAGHLSLYQLTIEEGTAFWNAHRRGKLKIPDEDLAADLYQMTSEMTESAGYRAYEISNYARAGEESRHNLVYWRYQNYVGVGPGAHGRLGPSEGARSAHVATAQVRRPEQWLARVEEHGHATDVEDELEPHTSAEEALMMGLRLDEGINEQRFQSMVGLPLEQVVNPGSLRDLTGEGFLVRDQDIIRVAPHGRSLLNAITGRLLG